MKVLSYISLLLGYFLLDSADGAACPSGVPNGCKCDMILENHRVRCDDIPAITEVASWLPNNTNELELKNCGIRFLNRDSFKNLGNLIHIEISNQQRRLSFNDSLVFQGLTRLIKVNLDNNNIASLPAGLFANLPRLDQVFLNNNPLETLPDDLFENSTSVQNIQLGSTRLDRDVIYDIGEGKFVKNLEILSISGTFIERLKDGLFNGLPKLKFLSISNCGIKSIGADILKRTEITSIFLDGNPIKFINESAFQGSKVTVFQCVGCQLTSTVAFNGFLKKMSLSQINLQNNNLTTIPEDSFTSQTGLKIIQLSNNPFNCDCNLAWLRSYVSDKKVTSDHSMWKCAKPESVADQLFVSLKMDEFCEQTSAALNCTECVGNGAKCTEQGQSKRCQPGDGLCGRVWFMQNGVQKVMERCALKEQCVGTIDCLKPGFELGNTFKGATNCVVSCCDGENCDPPTPLKCYQCQGKGKTCKTKSISCGYKEDRCLRINYKVGEDLMTDERCYQSSRCSNSSEICNLVKKNDQTVKECETSCCDKENCNAIIKPCNSFGMSIASLLLIGFLVLLVEILKL